MDSKESIFRIDTFKVSKMATNELIEAIKHMHTFLRNLSGYLNDEILIESSDSDSITIITILEWLNKESAKNASKLIRDMQQSENFNPQEIIKRNDIKVKISYLKKVKC